MISGQMYSFHSLTTVTSATVAMHGAETGTTMCRAGASGRHRRSRPPPGWTAGSVRKCWRSRNVPNAVPRPGQDDPPQVFLPPMPAIRM